MFDDDGKLEVEMLMMMTMTTIAMILMMMTMTTTMAMMIMMMMMTTTMAMMMMMTELNRMGRQLVALSQGMNGQGGPIDHLIFLSYFFIVLIIFDHNS